jgi:hypothetical protein
MRNRLHRILLVAVALGLGAYILGPELLLASPVVFGALTLEDAHLSFQRLYPDARSVPLAEVIRCFKKVHAEHLKNIQLQVVAISGLDSADVVVADAACKLYLLAVKKPAGSTTTVYLKGSDHASAQGANAELGLILVGSDTNWHTIFDPQGLPFGTGLTLDAHTTSSGTTKSAAADAPVGFAIIGAA